MNTPFPVFAKRHNDDNKISAALPRRTAGRAFGPALRAARGFTIAAALLLWADSAAAEQWHMDGDLFPFVTYSRLTALPPGMGIDKETVTRGADLFGLASHDEWRILAELMVDNTEGDPERLQLGRWIGSNTMLWIGRWHTPSAYWDMVYHHSPFLQTSITRPEIMNYEDDGGILPTHIWGLLASETIPQGEGEWQLQLGIGAGPQLANSALSPVKALTPVSPNGRLGVIGLVSYMPNTSQGDEFAAFVSDINIPSEMPTVQRARQVLGGAYMSWTVGDLHTIASIFDVHTRVEFRAGPARSHSFMSGYLHLEYLLTPSWRPYVRYEGSAGTGADPYVALFSYGLADSRSVLGIRYSVTLNQALSLEGYRARYNGGLSYNAFMFQWSAMFR